MGAPVTPSGVDLPALVLCGGRGTRLGTAIEKPLVTVCGEPMLDRVVRALRGSAVSSIHAVPSPQTPRTRAHAIDRGLPVVDAPGEGYVADLQHALRAVDPPVVTVAADLPLLAAAHVDRVLSTAAVDAKTEANATPLGSLTVCVPVALKRTLGVSVDTQFDHDGRAVAPTGLNVVGTAPAAAAAPDDGRTETVSVVADERLAVNVNRPRDREVAESRCD